MPDRPIIFSALMVRALLDGRKTQARGVLKPQPEYCGPGRSRDPQNWADPESWGWENHETGGWDLLSEGYTGRPYYAPGDRLWVREAWSGDYDMRAIKPQDRFGPARQPIWYWADTKRDCGQWERPRSPIHMPRWASRITLTVTDVRVQRVQDISNENAIAEGIEPHGHAFTGYGKQADVWMAPYDSFASLWNSIHGPGAWDANPWVCALAFTVRKGNIDHD